MVFFSEECQYSNIFKWAIAFKYAFENKSEFSS